ncbi:MYB-like transcription factor ETC3 [Arachis duranensis]|uniref:MYB-like transcription factor ETC3 n=1 Tax=Arachis duranensis TaxID=130453 RepID=A0A6P4DBY3_ARADU|nr:MYB-like transcription factor ETC3 [Arachis duranensis]
MEERRSQKNKAKLSTTASTNSEEVSSNEWEFIEMSEQEEDLIRRMYGLVGDRWDLIAGRIPGRKAEEIERFWIMRHGDAFSLRRTNNQQQQQLFGENSGRLSSINFT